VAERLTFLVGQKERYRFRGGSVQTLYLKKCCNTGRAEGMNIASLRLGVIEGAKIISTFGFLRGISG